MVIRATATGLLAAALACACQATSASHDSGRDSADARPQRADAPEFTALLAGETGYAVRCRVVLTADDEDHVYSPGMVATRGGQLVYVGPWIQPPAGYEQLDAGAAWAAPGMVDLHSHVHTGGWNDINDSVMPINVDLRTGCSIRPGNPNIRRACAGGVTTLFGIAGSGSATSGFGVLYKTKPHATYDEVVLREPGGLKVAQTHNPERRAGDLGLTRAGLSWLLQDALDKAGAANESGRFDPELLNLQRVLNKELPVLIHCAGGQGVGNTVRMWRVTNDTRSVLSHGSFNGWKVASYAADNGMPINHGPRTVDYVSSREGAFIPSGAIYAGSGGPDFSLNTDAPVVAQEELFLQGTMVARQGADAHHMLRAVTINPARAFGIDDRVGSLEPGKDADIVFRNGDPLDPRSRVELVMIDGSIQYDVRTDGQWF